MGQICSSKQKIPIAKVVENDDNIQDVPYAVNFEEYQRVVQRVKEIRLQIERNEMNTIINRIENELAFYPGE